MRPYFQSMLLMLTLALGACGGGTALPPSPPPPPPLSFDIDFTSANSQGWTAGSAEYPVAWENGVGFVGEIQSLPAPLSGSGYFLTGNNLSDDLFIYIKGRLTGLLPNQRYAVSFSATIATRAFSVGGDSMIVKAGAAAFEPNRQVSNFNGTPYYIMNLDKGQPTQGGANALIIGNLVKPNENSPDYELKTLNSANPLVMQTDSSGNLWVFTGVDSTFEVPTIFYYTRVRVTLQPQQFTVRTEILDVLHTLFHWPATDRAAPGDEAVGN